MKIELVSAGASQAVLRFSGTAARQGYINVELSPLQPSAPGTWVTSVATASKQSGAGGLWLRTALLDDSGYIGELFEGKQLPEGETLERISDSGIPPAEATRLLPYIQLWVDEGDEVDTTLTLADPSFVSQ